MRRRNTPATLVVCAVTALAALTSCSTSGDGCGDEARRELVDQTAALFAGSELVLQDFQSPGCDDSFDTLVVGGSVPATFTDERTLRIVTAAADRMEWIANTGDGPY